MYFRKDVEQHKRLFKKIMLELAEERQSVMSYMAHLNDTQRRAESKREKLRIADARNKEFEKDLLTEKELMEELEEEFRREKSSLLHVFHEDGSPRELKAKKKKKNRICGNNCCSSSQRVRASRGEAKNPAS